MAWGSRSAANTLCSYVVTVPLLAVVLPSCSCTATATEAGTVSLGLSVGIGEGGAVFVMTMVGEGLEGTSTVICGEMLLSARVGSRAYTEFTVICAQHRQISRYTSRHQTFASMFFICGGTCFSAGGCSGAMGGTGSMPLNLGKPTSVSVVRAGYEMGHFSWCSVCMIVLSQRDDKLMFGVVLLRSPCEVHSP